MIFLVLGQCLKKKAQKKQKKALFKFSDYKEHVHSPHGLVKVCFPLKKLLYVVVYSKLHLKSYDTNTLNSLLDFCLTGSAQ